MLPLLPLPSWRLLPLATRLSLEHADAHLSGLAAHGVPVSPELIKGAVARLKPHRLSKAFAELHSEVPPPSSAGDAEERVVGLLSTMYGDFEDWLVADRLGASEAWVPLFGSDMLRRGDSRHAPDRAGGFSWYPCAERIAPALLDLRAWLVQAVDRPALFAAAVAFVRLNNIHPLEDGNGRLSRVIFNHLLRKRHPALGYLPIRDVFTGRDGGLLLALREAHIYGTWRPILQGISELILGLPFLSDGAET